VQGKLRYDHNLPLWSYSVGEFVQHAVSRGFNGMVERQLILRLDDPVPRQGLVRHGDRYIRDNQYLAPLLWHIEPFHSEAGLSSFFLAGSSVTERVDGSSKVVVLSCRDRDREMLVWLDPDLEWCVRRYVSMRGASPIGDTVISYTKDANGIWLPSTWQFTDYDGSGRLVMRTVATATRAVANESPREEVFEVMFPENTLVTERQEDGSQRKFVVGARNAIIPVSRHDLRGNRSIQEILNSARPRGGLAPTMVLMAAGAGICSAAFLIWRWRRSRVLGVN
jgi:hypothetical protein